MPDWRRMIGHRTFDQLWADATGRLRELGSGVATNLNMGPFRLLLAVALEAVAVLYDILAEVVAPAGFVGHATGAWLDEAVADLGLERRPALHAEGTVIFGRHSASGPIQIPEATIVRTDPVATGDGLLFLTVTDTILPDSALEVAVAVRAEFPGAGYNVADGAIRNLVAHVAGIDFVTNRPGWLTREGTDLESDEQLRTRARLAWQRLATGGTAGAYRSWAMEVPGVAEAVVVGGEPRGPGTLDLIITSAAGSPTSQLLSSVQAHIDDRKPLLDNVMVKGPTTKAVDISVEIVLPAVGGDPETVETEARRGIQALFSPDEYSGVQPLLPGQGLYLSQIIWQCQVSPAEGVRIQAPLADEPAVAGQLLTLGTLTVTVVRRT